VMVSAHVMVSAFDALEGHLSLMRHCCSESVSLVVNNFKVVVVVVQSCGPVTAVY
jgi:hypothetical protein